MISENCIPMKEDTHNSGTTYRRTMHSRYDAPNWFKVSYDVVTNLSESPPHPHDYCDQFYSEKRIPDCDFGHVNLLHDGGAYGYKGQFHNIGVFKNQTKFTRLDCELCSDLFFDKKRTYQSYSDRKYNFALLTEALQTVSLERLIGLLEYFCVYKNRNTTSYSSQSRDKSEFMIFHYYLPLKYIIFKDRAHAINHDEFRDNPFHIKSIKDKHDKLDSYNDVHEYACYTIQMPSRVRKLVHIKGSHKCADGPKYMKYDRKRETCRQGKCELRISDYI